MSESWLWKATPAELSNFLGDAEKLMNRDVYSFWYPLDEPFIQDILNLADAADMDFVSFFWTRNLLSYLDYDGTPHNLTTAEYNRLINQASLANVQKGELSPLSQYPRQALSSRTNSRLPHQTCALNGRRPMLLCPHNPTPGTAQSSELRLADSARCPGGGRLSTVCSLVIQWYARPT